MDSDTPAEAPGPEPEVAPRGRSSARRVAAPVAGVMAAFFVLRWLRSRR